MNEAYEAAENDRRLLERSIELTSEEMLQRHAMLSGEIQQRMHAEQQLREAQASLERRVEERTAELVQANAALQTEIAERTQAEETLKKKNAELAVHNEVMLTREERVLDLKLENNELLKQLGRPKKYLA